MVESSLRMSTTFFVKYISVKKYRHCAIFMMCLIVECVCKVYGNKTKILLKDMRCTEPHHKLSDEGFLFNFFVRKGS